MKIEKLTVTDFRNIGEAEISFTDGVNLLYGNNAQGKTNIIEAVYYFARGKSFRTARDADMIRRGADFFDIRLSFTAEKRQKDLRFCIGKNAKIREKNGVKEESLSEMIGVFRAVLFCPEHLSLVKGAPEERRNFLNIAISQCYPAYIGLYRNYQKILENRNFLLKMAQKGFPLDLSELEIWSLKMAAAAADIYRYRRNYIEKLAKYAAFFLSELSDEKEKILLSYEADVKEGEDPFTVYKAKLTENVKNEVGAGYSLYGVHRDDLLMTLNGDPTRVYASQGQGRSVVLALKQAEGEVSRELNGEYPVFLYDDVLSELDPARQAKVLHESGNRQIIITSCREQDVREQVNQRIYTEGGTYVSSYR